MIRRLTVEGIQAMHDWLDSSAETATSVPEELLASTRFAEDTSIVGDAIDAEFATRLEWGVFAFSLLRSAPVSEVSTDSGLWSWLTLRYFDQVCPLRSNGTRQVGQRARYVPVGTDYRTYYRHLLAGPWRIVSAHAEAPTRAAAILAGPLWRPGELYEQIASRMELSTSPTVLPLVNELYLDRATGTLKRGAGGSGRGSPRRLADILMQFDLTFDIYGMPVERLLSMLPAEFGRFRSS